MDVIILVIIIVLTLIYLLPIILVRRLHTASNILTGNYGVTVIICSAFWIMYHLLSIYNPAIFIQSTVMCVANGYLQVTVNCLMISALAMITINRYFTITYPNKRLFKDMHGLLFH